MATFFSDGITYMTVVGSDVERDCFFSELYKVDPARNIYLGEAFWSDANSSFTVRLEQCEIPLSVLEAFLAEARSRVQPTAVSKESNFVMVCANENT